MLLKQILKHIIRLALGYKKESYSFFSSAATSVLKDADSGAPMTIVAFSGARYFWAVARMVFPSNAAIPETNACIVCHETMPTRTTHGSGEQTRTRMN